MKAGESPMPLLRPGLLLLVVWAPLGLCLEALHALKVDVYLGSAMRREMWTLAHAHGNFLALVCLAFAAVAGRAVADPRHRRLAARGIGFAAVLMPVGFFLGGIVNHEGDPSPGILLVPVGGVGLLLGLATWFVGARSPAASCAAAGGADDREPQG